MVSSVKVICEHSESKFNYFAWPTVARLPDGRLATVCSGDRIKHLDPFGKITVVYSEDEGKTWTKPVPLINTPLDDRDGGIAVSGNRVMLTTFNNAVALQRHWNEDENRSDPALYDLVRTHLDAINVKEAEEKYLGSLYAISENGGKTFGALRKLPVTAPHGPGVMPDGRFLYVGTYFHMAHNEKEGLPFVACYLEDGQGHFSLLSEIPNIEEDIGSSWEPHCIVLPEGKILVHIRFQRVVEGKGAAGWEEFTLYQSESVDGGKTFSPPRKILPSMGGAPAHLIQHSSGVLISAYSYRAYTQDRPSAICALISHDNGETWEQRTLCHGSHCWDMGYPASVETADGNILTVFYDHLENGPAVIKQITWTL